MHDKRYAAVSISDSVIRIFYSVLLLYRNSSWVNNKLESCALLCTLSKCITKLTYISCLIYFPLSPTEPPPTILENPPLS